MGESRLFTDREIPDIFGGQVCGRQTKRQGRQGGDQGSGPRACQFLTGQARTQTGSGLQERELKEGRPW